MSLFSESLFFEIQLYHFKILDSTCNWCQMIFFFLCLTYFTQYDALSVHPCCCKWPHFILFNNTVIFHCQKPSIYCLELDISKKFSSLTNLLIKDQILGGPISFPHLFKGFCIWESFSPFQREGGLSLVQQKASCPGVSCLFAWVLPCLGVA